MNPKIAIIDYGFGNIKSVLNALKVCDADAYVIDSPDKIADFGGAFLPGVGSFGPASDFLVKKGFDNAIKKYIESGKMLYGVCLGFQLLFTKGYENGEFSGLNLVEGEVKKFDFKNDKKNEDLKIPHMGWNNVEITDSPYAKKMFKNIKNKDFFYFVHSYYTMPRNRKKASSVCNYGIDFCSSAAFENVWGSQFHPEKSGDNGLKVLSNFINEVKR